MRASKTPKYSAREGWQGLGLRAEAAPCTRIRFGVGPCISWHRPCISFQVRAKSAVQYLGAIVDTKESCTTLI